MSRFTTRAGLTAFLLSVCACLIPPGQNRQPTALFRVVGPKVPAGKDGLKVTFDASNSSDDSRIDAYIWDFGDGSGIQTFLAPAGRNVDHTYLLSLGAVSVRLVVRDDDGDLSEPAVSTVLLSINRSPIAAFEATPRSGRAPLVVTFNAQASYDPDPGESALLEYIWRFGDGSGVLRTTSSIVTHPFNPDTPRSFVVELIVSDGQAESAAAYGVIDVVE